MSWADWLWSSAKKTRDDAEKGTLLPTAVPDSKPAIALPQAAEDAQHARFTPAQTVIACAATTASTLIGIRFYKAYLRRIPNINHLKPEDFRRRRLYGYVTSVGDGDNFRFFHTPGGRLAGWGWRKGRRVQDLSRSELRHQTIHVRIAGVDAPECAHFGRPAQPYGQEALDWLSGYIQHRYVWAQVYRRDQYERAVCMVHRRKWGLLRTDVGEEMIKRGWATVYEAKFGSEFGNKEEAYRAAERRARERRVGMWAEPGLIATLLGRNGSRTTESPREYKDRMAAEERQANNKAAK